MKSHIRRSAIQNIRLSASRSAKSDVPHRTRCRIRGSGAGERHPGCIKANGGTHVRISVPAKPGTKPRTRHLYCCRPCSAELSVHEREASVRNQTPAPMHPFGAMMPCTCQAEIPQKTLEPSITSIDTLSPRPRARTENRWGVTVVAVNPSVQTIVPPPVADSSISPTSPCAD